MLERHRDELEKRNVDICDMWLNHQASWGDISAKYGISKETARQVVRQAGLNVRAEVLVPKSRKLADRKPLSNVHAQLGHLINYNRLTNLKLETRDFARLVNLSEFRLRAIEMGVEDPTLCELQRICDVIKVPLHSLLIPKNGVDCGKAKEA